MPKLVNMKQKVLRSRPPLDRMMRIHAALKRGNYPTATKLGRDLEVSTKTIYRDIDFMRDRWLLPIDYDQKRFGYFYTEEVTHFPAIQVSEGELLALFVAQKSLAQYRGTPFETPVANAFIKLAAAMPEEITVSLAGLDGAVSFAHTGQPAQDLRVFQKVVKATTESRELEIDYHKLNAATAERRLVRPYHVACIDNQWYCFAYDLKRRALRTFVIGRIEKVHRIGRKFKKPEDFTIKDRLMGSFAVFKGEGDHGVRVEFDAFAGRLIRERRWHSTQEIQQREGGAVEISMRLDSLEEVERWVLSWGGHAKVLAPAELKSRVRAAARDMSGNYTEPLASQFPQWFRELSESARFHQHERVVDWLSGLGAGVGLADDPNQMRLRFG